MANPYVGQVSPFAFPYAPINWAFCDGSTVPLNQYTSLYALIGNVFGGDGRSTIGLPNLSGAAPCGTGQGANLTNRTLGQAFGTATVLLDQTTLPPHTHTAESVTGARGLTKTEAPTAASGLTVASNVSPYSDGGGNVNMSPNSVSLAGGNSAHNNQQPYIGVNYCIALMGQYPYFP